MTTNNFKLTALGAAIYLAGVAVLCITPAHAGVVEDPVTHWKTYVPDTGYPAPRYQPPPISVDPRPPSIQIQPFSCYLIGNIVTCQ